MPTKTTPAGRTYEVDGKKFTWTTEDGAQFTIPLRIKMKIVRQIPSGELDIDGMFGILELLVPDQVEVMDEMDSNDFAACFQAWNTEYGLLSGASLGEASGSAPSSQSTGQPSTTTGAPGSV